MKKGMKIASVGRECVACGCCVKVCPRGAICVAAGVTACVDGERCVGCGLCERMCPAAVITLREREVEV